VFFCNPRHIYAAAVALCQMLALCFLRFPPHFISGQIFGLMERLFGGSPSSLHSFGLANDVDLLEPSIFFAHRESEFRVRRSSSIRLVGHFCWFAAGTTNALSIQKQGWILAFLSQSRLNTGWWANSMAFSLGGGEPSCCDSAMNVIGDVWRCEANVLGKSRWTPIPRNACPRKYEDRLIVGELSFWRRIEHAGKI